jgi:hypothetical protein
LADKLKKKSMEVADGIDLIEMMYKSNIIALVYTNDNTKVVIWDDYEQRNRTEITFTNPVKNLRLRKDL